MTGQQIFVSVTGNELEGDSLSPSNYCEVIIGPCADFRYPDVVKQSG